MVPFTKGSILITQINKRTDDTHTPHTTHSYLFFSHSHSLFLSLCVCVFRWVTSGPEPPTSSNHRVEPLPTNSNQPEPPTNSNQRVLPTQLLLLFATHVAYPTACACVVCIVCIVCLVCRESEGKETQKSGIKFLSFIIYFIILLILLILFFKVCVCVCVCVCLRMHTLLI